MARRPLQGTITEDKINSQELNEEISLLIYTPPNFTPLNTYDVLICQDGSDYFQLGRIPRQAEELMEDAEMRETIIIGVPYPSVDERRKRYHPNGEKTPAYIRFLANELVPYIDDHYPTHQLASGRTLAGDSLAATVSLMAAVEYPSLFGQVMMHSPYVNKKLFEVISAFEKSEDISLYHVIGLKETAVVTTDKKTIDFLSPNRKLSELLKEKSFTYTYDEFDGDHTWTYWQKDLPRGLMTLLPYA
ncbi:esterase family protein [Halalkalibacter nanhaiisediminis]|uniref:Enterochelin esterase family protein n=1 Tax=Halalkalibacter nanhaiisediminis TaxID=688079 RepID=A0A562QM64_9BACI|nr:esterase family protein [Halalkalibacter nanhaiisediminis]TWI57837.1 enterochelin esterase family protein [Halalkalibacter nanhaiisediminis]